MLTPVLLHASTRAEGERLLPIYFTARDDPWLRALLDECARFAGRKRSEWLERLRAPLPVRAPKTKLRIAIRVLDALCRERNASAVPPKEARSALFLAAAAIESPRTALLEQVASSLRVTAVELENSLFADLEGERRIATLPSALSTASLARDANLSIVTSLVRRAASVRISASGDTRALIRQARVVGLLCTLSRANQRPDDATEGVVMDASGPFALFRHTDLYGRALASLIPVVAGCDHFHLTAKCALSRGGPLATLIVRSGDPIGPGRALARRETRLEAKFERDFRRTTEHWDVTREPAAVTSGDRLFFPDFEFIHRRNPQRRWLLEIVGFWTPHYLAEKLACLRAAGIERYVLCVDHRRLCAEGELPPDARIIRYKTRIDPRAVLALIER